MFMLSVFEKSAY